jgi:predicted kinase
MNPQVVLVGGTAQGTTTLAAELARRLGAEHVHAHDGRGAVDAALDEGRRIVLQGAPDPVLAASYAGDLRVRALFLVDDDHGVEAECRRRGLACVASRPWTTLVDRAESLVVARRSEAPPPSRARHCPARGGRRAA